MPQDGLDVQRSRVEAGHAARLGVQQHRPEQCLAGFARPVGAFSADQFGFHDDGVQAGGGRPAGHVLTDRSGADDDDVENTHKISKRGQGERCFRLPVGQRVSGGERAG
ncbi:hypothetical protein GCM10020220_098880 [Nonomuraea rubra]